MDAKFIRRAAQLAEMIIRSDHEGEVMNALGLLRQHLTRGGRSITEIVLAGGGVSDVEVRRLRAELAERETEIARLERKLRKAENQPPGNAQANEARRAAALEFAQEVAQQVRQLRLTKASTVEIAAAFNEAGITTREGGRWSHRQVRRVLDWLGGSWSPGR